MTVQRYPGEPDGIIAAAWRSFDTQVLAEDAGPIQRQEMRRGFYGGAQSLIVAVITALDPQTLLTERDMRRFEQLAAEMQAFAEAVQRGEA